MLLVACCSNAALEMPPPGQTPPPGKPMTAPLTVTSVDHFEEYIIGFPVHVAVTVKAHPDISFGELPFADFVDLRECIGLELSGKKDGSVLVKHEPSPMIDPDMGEYGDRLAAGEARRMLFDVSPLLGGTVREGVYVLGLSYVTPDATYRAEPVELQLRNPTSDELSMLATFAADRPQFPSWALWTVSSPRTPIPSDEIELLNPLRFNLVLRRLFHGPIPLARVDPTLLDLLNDLYRPEGWGFKAELLHARGETKAYQELRAELLRKEPGLTWWMRMLDEGGAYMKSFRVD